MEQKPLDSNSPVPTQASLPRALTESLISLLIAVILFRTFLAEGYMISTGSMAPALLGYHKRVDCPTCHTEFPFGVAYDTDEPDESAPDNALRQKAVCPNCGQAGILVGDVPRNHGDQLLVCKQSYLYRAPRRWEVIVFRNPADPLEAFVKRTIGLPGETVQIVDGDVLINGELCRKKWAEQREVRIPLHRHHVVADSPHGWHPHWVPESSDDAEQPTWTPDGDGFQLTASGSDQTAWVNYAHWIRRGGQHQTSVALASWPTEINSASVPPASLKYDTRAHRLSCIGAMPEKIRDRLLSLCSRDEFQLAVGELYEQSHIAPINDFYGYNSADQQQAPSVVRDVMWSGRVQVRQGVGEFRVEMSSGPQDFAAVFDFERREVRLYVDEQEEPVVSGTMPAELLSGNGLIEMSLFDQQAAVAVNGKPVLTPVMFQTPPQGRVTRHPVRFGAAGLNVRVDEVMLYRDIYYTPQQTRHGISSPYQLGDDEFFVMGDNSPVSHDSRRWDEAPVPRSLLVGKPFLVHLPSRPGELHIGERTWLLRLPDLERIRILK